MKKRHIFIGILTLCYIRDMLINERNHKVFLELYEAHENAIEYIQYQQKLMERNNITVDEFDQIALMDISNRYPFKTR